MRILGIDPGTIAMGYGVIDEVAGEITKVACGALTAPRETPIAQRLHSLYVGLCDIIERYEPDEAAIEEPFVARSEEHTSELQSLS